MPVPLVPTRPGTSLRLASLWVALLLLASALSSPARTAAPAPARGANGMVVSPDGLATRAGLEVLETGGNAVDAAVAVALTLAVTYPLAGNLGGGGLMLYRDAEGGHFALDFRETAPAKLRADMFLDEEGRAVPSRSLTTGLAVGVPGTVAGLADAHRRWGSVAWADLVAPAARLARDGFEVSSWLAETLDTRKEVLMARAASRAVFAPDGALLEEGDRLVQRDLAASLRRIAKQGPAGFYDGPVASALVGTVADAGGVLSLGDLARYEPRTREPLEGRYRGYRIITFPPPSSGGVALLQILGMLEQFDLRETGYGSSLTIHLMVEAERRAFADRARWLGDPDFFDVPVRALLDPAYLARRAADIRPDRATPSHEVRAGEPVAQNGGETTHLSVVDRRGAAVSMTVTLNRWFGTGIVAEGTGILLNNEIDDFAVAAGMPNSHGLVGGEANAVAGDKRPLSSMSPTIVEAPHAQQRPALVLGTPGGPTIITTVAQVLVDVIDHGMPLQEAVNAPRFHHQWQPDSIRHEIRAFPADVERGLAERGHRLELSERPIGNVNAIGLDSRGRWLGAADPRRQGTAAGY